MKWRPDTAFRMMCDALMVNIALLLTFALKASFVVWYTDANPTALLSAMHTNRAQYYTLFSTLTLLSLSIFSISGFYTRNRFYQSKFKAIVIAQAVSMTYLILGFGMYFLSLEPTLMTRPVMISSYFMTLAFLVSSRLWTAAWHKFLRPENGARPSSILDERSVLVVGGAGYIGSALLPRLLEAGYKVRLLDLFIYGQEAISPYADHPNLTIINGDFRQVDRVIEAVKGVGSVIHLGAIVGDPACALDEDLTVEVNLMATKMIAEICKNNGIKRFVFASTCSVYGASDSILDERSKLNPVSLYARTKIACEQALLEMTSAEFSPVILRFSTIFGLSGRTRFDLVVNLLTAKAVFESKITLFGGEQWRPFLHVEDAALSVFSALQAPINMVHGEVFNVGGNHLNSTLEQMAQKIKTLVPQAEVMELGNNQDRRNYRVEFKKIERVLKYMPKWTLEDGIRQVITAIQNGEVLDYGDARFDNAKYLKSFKDDKISSRHVDSLKMMIAQYEF